MYIYINVIIEIDDKIIKNPLRPNKKGWQDASCPFLVYDV